MTSKNKDQTSTATNATVFDQHSIADWQALAEKSLTDKSVAELAHVTAGNIKIDPLYTDRPDSKTHLQPTPLQRWDNRLALLGQTAVEQNTDALAGLAGGVSSLQLTLNSPGQDSEIGINEISAVLDKVQLDIVPISFFAGSEFGSLASTVESMLAALGTPMADVQIAFNADPIGHLAATGEQKSDQETLMQDLNKMALYTHKNLPNATAVCINATCYHNAGGSIEHELVATIATASIYMQSLLDAGLSEQSAHDSMVFQIACDADVLSNVVKLRVLKSLWHYVAKQMGVAQPRLQLTVESSKRMLSHKEPWVNHLRNVSCATAAAMGGAQSIIIHPHNHIDHQYIDTQIELSARMARNIPIILSEESALTFVHDPMGGAYAIEQLSSSLSDACWQALQQLERDGGLVDALLSGQYQASIAKAQQHRITRLQNETDVQVGVNRYIPSNFSSLKSPAANSFSDFALLTNRDAQSFEASS